MRGETGLDERWREVVLKETGAVKGRGRVGGNGRVAD